MSALNKSKRAYSIENIIYLVIAFFLNFVKNSCKIILISLKPKINQQTAAQTLHPTYSPL